MSTKTKTSILYRIGTEAEQDVPVTGYIVNGETFLFSSDVIPSNFNSYNLDLTTLGIGCGVTTIGDSAFQGCSFLVGTLDIPSTISYIGDSAFADAAFTRINFYGSTPPSVGSSPFGISNYGAEVHCPVGLSNLYQNAFGYFSTFIDDL